MKDLRVTEKGKNAQYRKGGVKQLRVTELTNFSHGEERSSPMRDGFYTRRYRSHI